MKPSFVPKALLHERNGIVATAPRILILEQDFDFAALLEDALAEFGYRADTYKTAKGAFGSSDSRPTAQTDRYQLIAADVQLWHLVPGLGPTAAGSEAGSAPILLMGHPTSIWFGWPISTENVVAVLRKPFDPDEFVRAVIGTVPVERPPCALLAICRERYRRRPIDEE